MKLSDELQQSLELAKEKAIHYRHDLITLEHILLSFLENKNISFILEECGANIEILKSNLDTFLVNEINSVPLESINTSFIPEYSLGTKFVLQIAGLFVQSAQKEEVNSTNVLISLFREKESHAVYFLAQQGITKLDITRYISHKVYKKLDYDDFYDEWEDADKQEIQDPLVEFCYNLNQKAIDGKIDPVIGRVSEIERALHILVRRKKNNPIFVGEAGVGKTSIVEGIAQKIADKKVPKELENITIYALNITALMAGTRFRGDFEERFQYLIEALKKDTNSVLFIDEIHVLLGAGSSANSALDASNILKPYLSNGDIRCIGSTTQKEYRTIFEQDRALARRFQKIDVIEPSHDETLLILQGLRKYYEEFHTVTYTDEALKSATFLAAKYFNDRYLPDKAIDIIDEVGASFKLQGKTNSVIDKIDIELILEKIAKIPTDTIVNDDKVILKDLAPKLKSYIFGQDEAIDKIVLAIHKSRACLNEEDKPIGSFLFSGPTGVGKTELAKKLATLLGVEFLRFDMSEYMEQHTVSRLIGSPPGYIGFDQGGLLTESVHKNPNAVLLLDEIEKAHESIYNLLLQVMDYATLTDTNGRKVDFRRIILIMTTNEGAEDSLKNTVGFYGNNYEVNMIHHNMSRAIERYFKPEFRNRLTSIIQFNTLSHKTLEKVIDKIIGQLASRLEGKQVFLEVTDTAKNYLIKKGYDFKMGARPLQRVIDTEITDKLTHEILFGTLIHGGLVKIDASSDKLLLDYKESR